MKKQLYLNFSYTKWIWILGVIIIVINLLTALGPSYMNQQPFIQFVNLLNIIVMVYILSSVQNIHMLISKNDSYHFLYALPIHKTDIIKGDYFYHAVMLVFTGVVFSTYVMINQDYHLYYGIVMIIGLSLIMMSIYLVMFASDWMDNAYIRYIIYFTPLFILFLFHFMPLHNTFSYDLNLGSPWEFYLFIMPFIVLGIGIIVYTASYYYAKIRIIKSDII